MGQGKLLLWEDYERWKLFVRLDNEFSYIMAIFPGNSSKETKRDIFEMCIYLYVLRVTWVIPLTAKCQKLILYKHDLNNNYTCL